MFKSKISKTILNQTIQEQILSKEKWTLKYVQNLYNKNYQII